MRRTIEKGFSCKEIIADFIAKVLIEKAKPEDVVKDVTEFRQAYQTPYYCFDNGLP